MESKPLNTPSFKMRTRSSNSYKRQELKFGAAPHDMLADFLINLNGKNREHLENVSEHAGTFKQSRLVESVFLICEVLRLEPFTAYQAIEILERFMINHIEEMFVAALPSGADGGKGDIYGSLLIKLSDKFMLLVFSCVQLASKLALHCRIVDNSTAVKFLQSLGYSYNKETLLESELNILKTLNFYINIPNPLTYVETLLEVLGYNDSDVPIKYLHKISQLVLQFVYLQRNPIYHNLLVATIENSAPSEVQRVKFLSVKEDSMLLAVSVIAVSAFILNYTTWDQVLEELRCITGINGESISDFSHIILKEIMGTGTPLKSL
ncbi:cyclin N-terminal domain-containing protein 1 [Acipenser ruthenus]|uniref:cyclin N-terminal domain-containing protein 1 n=1 Tax=Acipenser ruthenus TaxID=7906 RepID=UPI002741B241|nr:cyclin N-terminal domain-containing protein 1 [Acipenser ruthenus]